MGAGDVRAIADEALANTSYLVDLGEGEAAVLDPRRDVEEYLALADRLGLRIVASMETHLHADFISGSRELAAAVGADVIAPAGAELRFEHRKVREGEHVILGAATFDVLETPGHTPEHISYIMTDPSRAAFTGGSLIGGGAARTDLTGPHRTLDLARAQYHSLRRIAALGDSIGLHPTHAAGSFCSTGSRQGNASTIGEERLSNPFLAARDEDAFVDQLVSGFGSYPPYFLHLRKANRKPVRLADLPPVRPMAAPEAAGVVDRGAWLIDGRRIEQWAVEHPTGAVSISVRPQFASWLGWVVPFGEPIVLLVENHQLEEALRLSRRIGYDRTLGWVDGGIEGWRAAGLPTSHVEVVSPEDAALRADGGAALVDVRQRSEWATSGIPGAVKMELGDVIGGKRPSGDSFVAFCAHGERSATAASLLARDGISVAHMAGGFSAWKRAGLPVES
jgi:glyoxylase-like metal-dependent hydrolase (beta-lactamase superfamily II)/rhodanese-related sulfurtransferase